MPIYQTDDNSLLQMKEKISEVNSNLTLNRVKLRTQTHTHTHKQKEPNFTHTLTNATIYTHTTLICNYGVKYLLIHT